jgi:hypothetical protein
VGAAGEVRVWFIKGERSGALKPGKRGLMLTADCDRLTTGVACCLPLVFAPVTVSNGPHLSAHPWVNRLMRVMPTSSPLARLRGK